MVGLDRLFDSTEAKRIKSELLRGVASEFLANLTRRVDFARMIPRRALGQVQQARAHQAAAALIGPRQVGKTTLAFAIADTTPSLYLDLESREDREKRSCPALLPGAYADRFVILDEIHRVIGLFQTTVHEDYVLDSQ